jgi:hypothetical protein
VRFAGKTVPLPALATATAAATLADGGWHHVAVAWGSGSGRVAVWVAMALKTR